MISPGELKSSELAAVTGGTNFCRITATLRNIVDKTTNSPNQPEHKGAHASSK